MPLVPTLVAIMLILGSVFSSNVQFTQTANQTGEESAIAGNMAVYRNYVVAYAQNNPTITGVVPDGALGLPTWFSKQAGVANHVASGKAYVWYATPPPFGSALTYKLLQFSSNTINVGINRNGVLYNPLAGNTGIPVPTAITNGCVVFASS